MDRNWSDLLDAVDRRLGQDHSLAFYLGAIVVLLLIYPISAGSGLAQMVYTTLFTVLLSSGIFLVTRRMDFTLGSGLVLIVVTAIWVITENAALSCIVYLCYALYLGATIFILLRYIYTDSSYSVNLLFAGVCVYMLLGFMFAPIYMMIETLAPHSFQSSADPDHLFTWQDTIYYSFVTLTTVGYGDITPQTHWARAVAILQASIGVLFLATFIGRLVGSHIAEAQTNNSFSEDPDPNPDPEQ